MLLSVLLWTLMIQSTSLVYRGTLRLVVSQGCFPPIGPWTYDNWHIISLERREGTISLGVHTSRGLWGAALPWAILHTSLLSLSKWRGCAPSIVHNSSYLLGAHIGFAIFISSFCPPHLSLRLCQFVGFHGGLFFNVFVAKPFDTSRNVDITLRS